MSSMPASYVVRVVISRGKITAIMGPERRRVRHDSDLLQQLMQHNRSHRDCY